MGVRKVAGWLRFGVVCISKHISASNVTAGGYSRVFTVQFTFD